MDFFDFVGKYIKYILGIGALLIVVGFIVESKYLIILGATPFFLLMYFFVWGLFYSFLDDLLPNFRGKSSILSIIALLIAVLLALIGFTGGFGEEIGVSYRGVTI